MRRRAIRPSDAVAYKASGVGKMALTAEFSNPDNDPKGPWASKPWKVGSDQSGSRYQITTPTGKVLNEEWMGERDTYEKYVKEGRIYFPKGGDGLPRKKYYRFEREEEGQCATNWWVHEIYGNNQEANEHLSALFDTKNVFSNPKPVKLIKGMLDITNIKQGQFILDFFSGSATTAEATMWESAVENLGLHYVLVQLPEEVISKPPCCGHAGRVPLPILPDLVGTRVPARPRWQGFAIASSVRDLLQRDGRQRLHLLVAKTNGMLHAG